MAGPTLKALKPLIGRHVIVTVSVNGGVRAYGSGREMVLRSADKDSVTIENKYKRPYVISRAFITNIVGFADEVAA